MILRHDTATEFLQASGPLLVQREAENNLILGLAGNLVRDIHYYGEQTPVMISLHLEGKCVGACIQTPPKNLIIYVLKEHLDQSIPALIQYLHEQAIQFPGIIGPKETVHRFNQHWSRLKKLSARLQMDEMIYKLEKLNPIRMSEGNLRQAVASDQELVADWMGKFIQDAGLPGKPDEITPMAQKKLAEGAIYLWETDKPVSMAGWTRPTQHGVTIAYVYTPKEHRKQGYASSCVAKLSELLLQSYTYCSLFTDLSNPTSNSIYQYIGYKPIEHVWQCEFVEM